MVDFDLPFIEIEIQGIEQGTAELLYALGIVGSGLIAHGVHTYGPLVRDVVDERIHRKERERRHEETEAPLEQAVLRVRAAEAEIAAVQNALADLRVTVTEVVGTRAVERAVIPLEKNKATLDELLTSVCGVNVTLREVLESIEFVQGHDPAAQTARELRWNLVEAAQKANALGTELARAGAVTTMAVDELATLRPAAPA